MPAAGPRRHTRCPAVDSDFRTPTDPPRSRRGRRRARSASLCRSQEARGPRMNHATSLARVHAARRRAWRIADADVGTAHSALKVLSATPVFSADAAELPVGGATCVPRIADTVLRTWRATLVHDAATHQRSGPVLATLQGRCITGHDVRAGQRIAARCVGIVCGHHPRDRLPAMLVR